MKIVYLGSGEFGIECLNALAGSANIIEFIVTQPAQPAGRGRESRPTSVATWADSHSIPFTETENVNVAQIIEKIAGYKPDIIVVIAFGQKIGKELAALPRHGAINVHASLLPKYRGAAPINWAIVNGERETGVSIITLAEKIDSGEIISHAKTAIGVDETACQLHDRLARMAAPLLAETIEKIANGTAVYTEQNEFEATRAPKLKKSDGFLDFNEPAESLRRKILGFWPWPEASAIYVSKKTTKCQRAVIAGAEVVETSKPNSLAAGLLDENLNVICGEDTLKISKIKPAGGRLMDFRDFVNGFRCCPGDLFMKIDE